ncbi:DUF6759 domain-containing protein [Chryseobacterium sp. ERMR1:04]|uniref:DUF6759 domain-containing protein n=1 Tax=Chryseobacterium sp. ERMR1:04 TaxID=1705393 RepID=UPI0006C83241|nr:DUF6759 domain-containing protein [Chryseobacterium sp. ERMR1:04]KPH12258.1 competence protein ComL [Chryseobacterium sp. ERMR1:04]
MKKKYLLCSLIVIILHSCGVNPTSNYPVKRTSLPKNTTAHSTNSASQVEMEYNTLIKTYKPETTEVLNDILNGSEGDKTSITVENNSRCNMVLTISGTHYFKKIPIAANKTGYAMVPKNQNYNLSGMLCNSVYKKTTFVTSTYKIKLSN